MRTAKPLTLNRDRARYNKRWYCDHRAFFTTLNWPVLKCDNTWYQRWLKMGNGPQ